MFQIEVKLSGMCLLQLRVSVLVLTLAATFGKGQEANYSFSKTINM